MFDRDAVTNFTTFITPDIRYVGDDYSRLKLDVMKDIYCLVTYNIKLARERMIKNQGPVSKPDINIGDLVLVCDHTSKSFQPRFKEDFRVVSIKGNSVEVKNNHRLLPHFTSQMLGRLQWQRKSKNYFPNFKKFGRKGKLCMNPDLFEDLGWTLDRDPPDLTVFRDNNTNKSKESVENTIKGVAQNISKIQNIIQVPSVKTNTPITPQKPKLRRSQRLKAKITNAKRNIKNAIKGGSRK